MFISAEVEVNVFIWSVGVLLFRVCGDGHMASDGVLYMHRKPFIYVYVHACFWHRTENFEHLPCGPSRVLEPQWRGQMDWILLLHSLQFTQTARGTKSRSDRALDREISSLKWRKKNPYTSKKEPRCLKVEKITKNPNYQEANAVPASSSEWSRDRNRLCAVTFFTTQKIKLNDSLGFMFKNELLLRHLWV